MLAHAPQCLLQINCEGRTERSSNTEGVLGPRTHDGTWRSIAKEKCLYGACTYHQPSASFNPLEKLLPPETKVCGVEKLESKTSFVFVIGLGRHCLSPLLLLCSVCKESHRFDVFDVVELGNLPKTVSVPFLQNLPRQGLHLRAESLQMGRRARPNPARTWWPGVEQ